MLPLPSRSFGSLAIGEASHHSMRMLKLPHEKAHGKRDLTPSCEMVPYITYSNRGGESPSALPYSVGGKLVASVAHTWRRRLHKGLRPGVGLIGPSRSLSAPPSLRRDSKHGLLDLKLTVIGFH